MRSALPKVLHPVAGQSLLAHVLGGRPEGSGRRAGRGDRPGSRGRRRRGKAVAAGRRDFRAARAPRHRACGAGGPRRHCPRRRRSAGGVRRHAADLGRHPGAAARAAEKRRRARRARISRRRSHRLWPPAGRGRSSGGDPRAGRRQCGGTRDHALQCRRDGVRRPQGACDHRKDRQRQQQARVLSDRRGRYRSGFGIGGRRDRNQRG